MDQKAELVDRVCCRIKDRYLAKEAGALGWWSPILGRVMPDQTIAVRGAWSLQRHFLAKIVASFRYETVATLRGPAALLDGVLEEAVALRADVPRERILGCRIRKEEWEHLAEAMGRLDVYKFKFENVEHLAGVELHACARWFFGMTVAHADVDIEVVDHDTVVHLVITDGREVPPTCRRRRLTIDVMAMD